MDDEGAVAAGLARLRGGLRDLIGRPIRTSGKRPAWATPTGDVDRSVYPHPVAATIRTEDGERHEGLRFRQSNRETILAYAEAVDATLAGDDSLLARFVDAHGYTLPGGAKRVTVYDMSHRQRYLRANGDDLRRFSERVEPHESPSPRR